MVLQDSWQGLSWSDWLRDYIRTIRLQCGICELDGRLECWEESMVLQEPGQGLPSSGWWLRMRWSFLRGLS